MFAITIRDETVLFETKGAADAFAGMLGIPAWPYEIATADYRLVAYQLQAAKGGRPFFVYRYGRNNQPNASPCTLWEYCVADSDAFAEEVWAEDEAGAIAAYEASRPTLPDH